ncbi:MAG: redoxin domain-containing protein [Myxococcales bacterium]|nr:redoxin domain-containing protein [Myxococcales bacterium]
MVRNLLVPARLHVRLPTEIRGFQSLAKEFKEDGVEVIGASTDSFFSHKAWFADKQTFNETITHPVIADTNHEVSRAFGVLKEDQGIAFRATVIVDDKGIIRSVSMNDLSVGRSPPRSAPHGTGPAERRTLRCRVAQGQ